MNAKQFFDLTAEMRKAQREYFKTRSHTALQKSKALEKRIDDEIDRVERMGIPPQPASPSLFPEMQP